MSEIDLIPVPYRRRRRFAHWLLRGGGAYLGVLALLVGVRVLLGLAIEERTRQIEDLKLQRERAELEHERLIGLRAEQQDLSQRLAVLDGLRGGVEAKAMFTVLDRALDEDVWFRRWSFRRAGEIVEKKPEAVETGYFIVLPKTAEDEPERAWRLQTHMELSAESEDHASLARFVRILAEQREIENTRILSTRSQPESGDDRVDFELAIMVRSTR